MHGLIKSFLNLFSSARNRKSIPETWCGLWTDKNGKQIKIESTQHEFYVVSIMNSKGQPYQIKLLDDSKRDTINLTGRFVTDTNGYPILQVEAGENGLGPTYSLYFLTTNEQKLRLAKNSDDLNEITIKPNVGLGLYDDWEDDLGVPWAFPLEDFKKV